MDRGYLLRVGIVAVTAALVAVGLAIQGSVSEAMGFDLVGRQFHWCLVAAAVGVAVAVLPTRWILAQAWPLYLGCLGLLALVPIIGVEKNSSKRWIEIGISVQPSELMKVGFIVLLARLLRHRRLEGNPTALLLPGLVFAAPALLIFAQPDLGTTLLFVPVALAMIFVSGLPLKQMGAIIGSGAAFAAFGYVFLLEPYQRARILSTFMRSRIDPAERLVESYQLEQSVRSVGIGGFWGQGLGEGIQNRLDVLPYRHNDFIYAVLAEELGFVGSAALILGLLLLLLLIFRAAVLSRDPAGRLICIGVGTLLAFQSFVHIGVNIGIVPTTGMTLPLVSAGGTSLLTFAVGIALVLGTLGRPVFAFGSDPDREQIESLRRLVS